MQQKTIRRVGVLVLLSPTILALPLLYWAFNYAGTWYVSTRLEPAHRAFHLWEAWILDLVMLVCLTAFPGLLLLSAGGYRVNRLLVALSALLLVPGMFLLYFTIYAYSEFAK
jgi:hypothetical protein